MGHEALEAAIADYYNEEITIHQDEEVVCNCFHITKTFLENEIKSNNLKTIDDVINYTKAGGACGRCQGKIKAILDNINSEKPKQENLTKTQLIIKINNIIEKYISPELRKDGGDIELIDVEDNKIKVKLSGKCQLCNRSQLTLTHFVEATLREHIDENIEIIQV